MNRLSLSLLALALGVSSSFAGEKVPYRTDLSDGSNLDPAWSQEKRYKGNNAWEAENSSDYTTTQTFAGMVHRWESDYTPDAMMISPAITLTEGTEYTVSLWARTYRFYDEVEVFKIYMGTDNSFAGLKASQVLIERTDYVNTGDYELISATFTASATGDVYFGIHCCSEKDMGDLYVTGFSIVEGSEYIAPEPTVKEAVTLPYTADFSTAKAYRDQWSSLAGPDAEKTLPWTYNSYSHYPEFDAYSLIEDNYLISPALKIEEAGNYKVEFTYTAFGTFDIVLGTDVTKPESFDKVLYTVEDVTDFETPASARFSIDAPGEYYIAMHVRAIQGSSMGYRLHAFKVKADLPVPEAVADLKVTGDATDAVKATLRWTNPSLSVTGSQLTAISKAVIMRDGTEIATITEGLTPGAESTFTDTPAEAGCYTYSVTIYNEYGTTDAKPMAVKSPFLGHPVADMPYSIRFDFATAAEKDKFTSHDLDGDGSAWEVINENYTTALTSEQPENPENDADNYVATPYLTLAKGYYRLTYGIGAREQSYRSGYATSRHDIAGTFHELADVYHEMEFGINDRTVIVDIPADGEYCFAWHHYGRGPAGYSSVSISRISVEPQALLPGIATAIIPEAKPGEAEGTFDVTVAWTNPAIDNAGNALLAISKAEIRLDGELVATLTEGLEPGKESTYSYTTAAGATEGEHVFTVTVYNENGCSEAAAPTATLFIGTGRELPYTADFKEWNIVDRNNTWYSWAPTTSGELEFSQSYGEADDYAFTPYLALKEGDELTATIVTAVSSLEGTKWRMIAGNSPDVDRLVCISEITTVLDDDDRTDTFRLRAGAVNTEADSDVADETFTAIPTGNVVFGVHMPQAGSMVVRSFAVEKTGNSGCSTVIAAAGGISYSAGLLTFAPATESVAIYDATGRMLHSATGAADITVAGRFASPVIIVVATAADGSVSTLKIKL